VLVALRAMRWSAFLIGLAALTTASLVVADSSRTSGFDVDGSTISQQEDSIVPEQQLLQQQDIEGYGNDPAQIREEALAQVGTGLDQVVQIFDVGDSIISQQEDSIVPEQQFLQQQDIEGYGNDPAQIREKNQVGTGLVQVGDGSAEGADSAEDSGSGSGDENSSGSYDSSGSGFDPAEPTAEPTAAPTAEPTAAPTVEPTAEPTAEPTSEPTAEPTTSSTTSSGSEGSGYSEGYAGGYAEGYAAAYAEAASELSGSGVSYGADYSSNCDCSCHNDSSYACTQWPDSDSSATLGSNAKCGSDDGCFGEGTFCYNGSDDDFGCDEGDNMSTCCTSDSGSGSLR